MSGSKRPRLKMLRSSISTLGSRLQGVPRTRTKRLTGRRGVDRRRRWLDLNPLCARCEELGKTRAGAEVDHITPLAEGGTDDESNFQTLCIEHHREKSAAEAANRGGGG